MSQSITVITITRSRPEKLERAIRSVQRQVCEHPWRHLVLVDDCRKTARMLSAWQALPASVEWRYEQRQAGERSGPGRSSKIRNIGVQRADSRWIAFIDDDNEWETDHLQTLVACAVASGVRAVHSHLQAFHPDGSPYLDPVFPWARETQAGREIYRKMVDQGVYTPGSNIFKDRADPPGTADPVRSVDTGEWLLARDLLLEVPFRTDFDAEDAANLISEDDKLLNDLIERAEPIACTHRATLIYYLGGYSNNFSRDLDASFAWV